MKKVITYTLVALMFIAVNFQSVCYLMYVSGHSIVLSPNFLNEEEKHESEKSDEKSEKKDPSEYLFHSKIHTLTVINQQAFGKHSELLDATSDYSVPVFSPPEEAAI